MEKSTMNKKEIFMTNELLIIAKQSMPKNNINDLNATLSFCK